jgi:hypothetical protein
MGRRYYPTDAELAEIDRKKKKEKEGPSFVDEMKAGWDRLVADHGGNFANASEEAKKRLKARGK